MGKYLYRRGLQSKKVLNKIKKYESPNVTYHDEEMPIVMKKASGTQVRDIDGHTYTDFTACFGALPLGHRPKKVTIAMRAQLGKMIHGMGDAHTTREKAQLLELLARIAPMEEAQSILSLSGGSAVESALKTAILATNRSRFLSFEGGYHGLQMGPLSLSSRHLFREGFQGWISDKSEFVPVPLDATLVAKENTCAETPLSTDDIFTKDSYCTEEYALSLLEDKLKTKSFAALVAEPLQGRAGERTFPKGFLKKCQTLCHQYGTLFILDEVFTGFYRTGSLYACEDHGVIPDLLVLGKALGGGMPISACVGNILDVWGDSAGESRHTSTFQGHPLSCVSAHTTVLEVLRRGDDFRTKQDSIEAEWQTFLAQYKQEELHRELPFIRRGQGYMHGIWFYNSQPGMTATLNAQLLKRGFLTLPSGPVAKVLALTPPLVIKPEEYRRLFKAIIDSLKYLVTTDKN